MTWASAFLYVGLAWAGVCLVAIVFFILVARRGLRLMERELAEPPPPPAPLLRRRVRL